MGKLSRITTPWPSSMGALRLSGDCKRACPCLSMKLEFRLKKSHDRARVPSEVGSLRPLAASLGLQTVVIASSANGEQFDSVSRYQRMTLDDTVAVSLMLVRQMCQCLGTTRRTGPIHRPVFTQDGQVIRRQANGPSGITPRSWIETFENRDHRIPTSNVERQHLAAA